MYFLRSAPQLQRKAKLDNVQVLELPKWNVKIPAGKQCEVAGWGERKPGEGVPSALLYEAKVTLEKPAKCKAKWQMYFNRDQMTCSVSNGKEGVCQVSQSPQQE